METNFVLEWIDYAIMLIYFGFVLGVGWALKRYMKDATAFLEAGRSLPAWVTGLAFISANLGALEIMGMAANSAKYGMMTMHFYLIGAIPGMVFLALFMMPFYYGSKARSVPEYLKLRFDEKTRGFNAFAFAIMTLFSSGISMFAMALLAEVILPWKFTLIIGGDNGFIEILDYIVKKSELSAVAGMTITPFDVYLVISSMIVLTYTYLGGLSSAIYNEVLQFFLIVVGFLPLVYLGLEAVGGWEGIKSQLGQEYLTTWSNTVNPEDNKMGIDWFGIFFGLGFVLAFGYWCTNFLVVQRAMAADSMASARKTPLIGAIPKMFIPVLVVIPGLVAAVLLKENPEFLFDPAVGKNDYNLTIPHLLVKFFPSGVLGLGLTALLASFMSGMAGNVTAFNTVWTYDIYQSYINPGKPDSHYFRVGRLTTVMGVLASILTAYVAREFDNIMDFLQLVFAFVNAPLFATFLLGMFSKRSTGHGAFYGLLLGTIAAAVHHGLTLPVGAEVGVKGGWITALHTYQSEMAQSFYTAIYAFSFCFVATWVISRFTTLRKTEQDLVGLVYQFTPKVTEEGIAWYKKPQPFAILVVAIALILTVLFW
jgi:solute:Na+ symporter, SSS family